MSVIDQTVVDTEPVEPPAAPPPSPGRFRAGLIGTVAGLVLGGGLVGGLVYARTSEQSQPAPINSTPAPVSRAPGGGIDVRAVLGRVEPAVVSIAASANSGRLGRGTSAGTGMILTPEGHVLTNAHVVEGASTLRVTVPDKGTHNAQLLGIDESSDMAVIKIQDVSGLPTVALGESKSLNVGDPVVAVGNALGLDGSPTVTTGIVSALEREIGSGGSAIAHLIQTDAAINPGNSGGPLVDSGGNVVGMNTAVAGGAQNIGFAIAIDQIKPKLDDLKKGASSSGAATSGGFLGVTLAESTSAGALVAGVADGSPAATAGLQPGDLIVRAGDDAITSPNSLVVAIRSHKPGDKLELTYLRDGDRRTATATLGSA